MNMDLLSTSCTAQRSRTNCIPLVGLDGCDNKWKEIEVNNLTDLLLRSDDYCLFFKVGVNFYDVHQFVTSGGSSQLRLHCEDEYLCIKNSPENVAKYLLLYEPFPESFQNNHVKLIGIGLFKDFADVTLTGRQTVDVSFLSLSRSGLDISTLDAKNHSVVSELLKQYIEGLQNETICPYLNSVYPWLSQTNDDLKISSIDGQQNASETQSTSPCTLPTPSTIFEKDCVHVDNPNNMKQPEKRYLPPLLNLMRNSGTTCNENKNWFNIEYRNINEALADSSNSLFMMVDMTQSDLYIAVYYNGLVDVPKYICDNVGDCSDRRVYLVIRIKSLNFKRSKAKPVVSIVKVLQKCPDGKLKIIFLTASKPQYVGVPWSEEEIFTSGQLLQEDDVRILLGEYKLSLRHSKVKPLFEDVYPWCERLDPDKTHLDDAGNDFSKLKPSQKSLEISNSWCEDKKSDDDANDAVTCRDKVNFKLKNQTKPSVNVPNCFTDNKQRTPPKSFSTKSRNAKHSPRSHGSNNRQCKTISPMTSPQKYEKSIHQQNRNEKASSKNTPPIADQKSCQTKQRRQPQKLYLPPAASPEKPTTLTKSLPQKSSYNKAPSITTNCSKVSTTSYPSDKTSGIPMCYARFKRPVPLIGLQECNNNVLTWHEIELNNLEHLIGGNRIRNMDVFLCDTSVNSIHTSFRDSMLEISRSNMENVASLSRSAKCFILRTAPHNSRMLVPIGIALVTTTAGIAKLQGRFYVQVSYLCLSIPRLKALSGPNHFDGMEVFPNVVNNFVQQYKLQLTRKQVSPLFVNIYPWCPRSPLTSSSKKSPSPSNKQNGNDNTHWNAPLSPTPSDENKMTMSEKEMFFEGPVCENYLFRDTESSGITFKDIQRDLARCSLQNTINVIKPPVIIADRSMDKQTVMSALLSNHNSIKGRGRGTLLMQQAGQRFAGGNREVAKPFRL